MDLAAPISNAGQESVKPGINIDLGDSGTLPDMQKLTVSAGEGGSGGSPQ
jgi:hypothetical protein